MNRPARFLAYVAMVCPALPAFAEGPFKDLSYDDALRLAEKEKKIVVIDFYTTWCGPCKMLDRSTWKDEDVLDWFKNKAVGLKIDAEKEKALAKKFKVSAYPTIILIKADGAEIDRLTGYRNAEDFPAAVEASLNGKGSLARAKDAADEEPKDPSVQMDYAQELARRGKHEEALKIYLWCFDEGEKHSRSFSGVRISFLLSAIVRLGDQYPPALDALRERRDRNEETILSGFERKHGNNERTSSRSRETSGRHARCASVPEKKREAACDAVYISKNLEEVERALAFYDKLRALGDRTQPIRACMMMILFDPLADAGRYKDIIADGGDPLEEIDQQLSMWSMEKRMYKKDKDRGKEMLEMRMEYLIKRVARNYEVLVGAGEFDDAETAAKKILEFEKSARSYNALINGALRARSLELAEELASEANKTLPEDERDKVMEPDEIELPEGDDDSGDRASPPDKDDAPAP